MLIGSIKHWMDQSSVTFKLGAGVEAVRQCIHALHNTG